MQREQILFSESWRLYNVVCAKGYTLFILTAVEKLRVLVLWCYESHETAQA